MPVCTWRTVFFCKRVLLVVNQRREKSRCYKILIWTSRSRIGPSSSRFSLVDRRTGEREFCPLLLRPRIENRWLDEKKEKNTRTALVNQRRLTIVAWDTRFISRERQREKKRGEREERKREREKSLCVSDVFFIISSNLFEVWDDSHSFIHSSISFFIRLSTLRRNQIL